MLTPIQLLLSRQMLLLKQVAVLLLLISTVLFSSTQFVQANTTDNSAVKNQDYLLVLTSQRNAETVAEAARLFKLQYPQLSIQARTDGQIYETDNKQRAQLILNARAIIGAGLFGPAVAELSPLFKQFKKQQKPLLIFSSDHRLVGMSELAGKNFFSSQQQVRELGKQRATDNFEIWLNNIKQQNPAQASWLQARAYWQAGGAENSKELFSWVFQQTGAETLANAAVPQPRLRWFANGKIQNQLPALTSEPATEKKPLIAILDHAGGGHPADAALLRKLCAQIEEQGQQCIASLAYWGEAGVKAVEQLLPYKDQLSVIVMLQDFVIGGGEGRERCHYDLHTAIRGSEHEKFAVHPFMNGAPYSNEQLGFLAACGINAVLFANKPSTTFSYSSSNQHGAHAFTLELGKVYPFGQNDLSRFSKIDSALRQLISDGSFQQADWHQDLLCFNVCHELIKEADDFALEIADDVNNFATFSKGATVSRSSAGDYQAQVDDEAIVFPNANVPIGGRAALMLARTQPDDVPVR